VLSVTPPRFAPAIRVIAIAAAMAASARAALWVSPAGDDGNPGTEEQPLRTVERARDVVRTLNRDMADDITVFIAGDHHVDRPIAFGPEDSGSNGFNIVYTAAPGEHPVLSGGVRVGGWSVADKACNLWSAPAPAGLANARGLFVNGTPASRTRGRLLAVFSKDPADVAAAAPDPKAQWKNPDDVVFEPAEAGSIWSERSTASPAYVENAFELLGMPGDWYFDRPSHRIYYAPRAGEDLATADVEAASAEALIACNGAPDRPVTSLVFKGIRFEFTAQHDISGDEPAASPPAAVGFAFAAEIQFLEDDFLHMGTPALDLGRGVHGVKVEGCLFADVSWSAIRALNASGISVVDSRFSYTATGHITEGAIEVDDSADVSIEHDQIDHFPTVGILARGPQAGAVREASNEIAAPMIGLHGGSSPVPGAPAAADAGISPYYRALTEEKLSAPTIPRPPTDVSAEAEDEFAYVTWLPSCQDGGSPVESYTVSSSAGAKVTVSTQDFEKKGYVMVSGLGNGQSVSFTVSAVNGMGASPPSLPTAAVKPNHKRRFKPPAPPAAVSVTTGISGISVQITPPASNGGSPVVSYLVSAGPPGEPTVIEGLDVIHSDAAHPLQRTLAEFPAGAGSTISVAAANAAGAGKPVVIKLPL
jgi:fibronectin type III domain protein/glycosyl hydrolase family 141